MMNKLIRFLFKGAEPPNKKQSIFSEYREKLNSLSGVDFSAVYSIDISIYTINPAFPNIEIYQNRLHLVNTKLVNDEKLPYLSSPSPVKTSIRRWFINKEGKMLDANQSMQDFIESADAFISMYDEIDKKSKDDIALHNHLVCTPLMSNLCLLVEELHYVERKIGNRLRS